jgi:hypothetical protein
MQAVDFRGKWSVVLGVQLEVVPHTSRSMCGRNHTVDKTQFLFDIKRLGSVQWAAAAGRGKLPTAVNVEG